MRLRLPATAPVVPILVGLALIALTGGGAAQRGFIVLTSPPPGASFEPGDVIAVVGRVRGLDGAPMGNVTVSARLADGRGATIPGTEAFGSSNPGDGGFLLPVDVPVATPPGVYFLRVASTHPNVSDVHQTVLVQPPRVGFAQNLAVSAGIVISVAVAAAVLVALSLRPRRRGPDPGMEQSFGKPQR